MNASSRGIFLECAMRYPLLWSRGARAGMLTLLFHHLCDVVDILTRNTFKEIRAL